MPQSPETLKKIADADVEGLLEAEKHYGDSWKQRGGVGAFMMLARKWDRIEKRVSEVPVAMVDVGDPNPIPDNGDRYDIFQHIFADPRPEGLIDDVRDLRRYLMLVEAEMVSQGAQAANSIHRDNKV